MRLSFVIIITKSLRFCLVNVSQSIIDMLQRFSPHEGGVSELISLHSLHRLVFTLLGELVNSLKSLLLSATSASLS
jgi:hypothetical protein